jgi:hypothetical protein
MPAHPDLLGYHVRQIIAYAGPHLRHYSDLYFYIYGFSPGGTHFYVQDSQLVAAELPLEVRVRDGQFLEFLLCKAWQDGFEKIRKDIFAAPVAEQEFEGKIDFGKHNGHDMNIPEELRKGKRTVRIKSLNNISFTKTVVIYTVIIYW